MEDSNNLTRTMILVTRNGLGSGEPIQQQKLFKKYINLLCEQNFLPSEMCFYTEGVKLAVEGSPAIEELKKLQAKGVKILVCLTCLKYYDPVNQLLVGTIASMPDIIQAQFGADKVITV